MVDFIGMSFAGVGCAPISRPISVVTAPLPGATRFPGRFYLEIL
jgi:hypothetical protein